MCSFGFSSRIPKSVCVCVERSVVIILNADYQLSVSVSILLLLNCIVVHWYELVTYGGVTERFNLK